LPAPLFLGAVLAVGPFGLGPPPPIRREPQIVFLDRSGGVIGVRGGKFGPPVDINRYPTYVSRAFVAIEDKRFFEHSGIDPIRMAGAVIADISHGGAQQGASTITQQLAKNVYLSREKTLERKAEEALLALKLEQTYSKAQILGLYLSRVNFGSGAYGLEAASRRFFDKDPARLTVREAAMLAAVMKAPETYSPVLHPEANRQRANLVIAAMQENGFITAAQAAHARAETPRVFKASPTGAAQYFIDWIEGEVRTRVGSPASDVYVDTTLDKGLESTAANALRAGVEGARGQGVQQGALVSMDGLGRVRALVGGVDYVTGPYNRAVSAHRQAGSTWKPFVYLAALEAGRTPDTMADDEPVTINGWSPSNYENEHFGPITLSEALAHSVNTVAAKLADDVGRDKVTAVARRLGITAPISQEPAMALGAVDVTPLEMAQAYGAFGNGGYSVNAFGLTRIRTPAGAVLYERPAPGTPNSVIAEPQLSQLNQMMRGVIGHGTGVRAAVAGYDLAGKTGTTSDYKDAWFDGYASGMSVVVWVGRDDDRPMARVTGGSAPALIWRAYMTAALKRQPPEPLPTGRSPPPTPTEVPPTEPTINTQP
jgi:penicillin-binding protein 1A